MSEVPPGYSEKRQNDGVSLVGHEYPPAQSQPQQDYPPQGYPPSQPPVYPQAQQSYAPQPQAYPGQQQGYMPPPGAHHVHQTTIITQAVSFQPDHMGFSIFTLLCCCWCVGIAAVVNSCAAKDANQRGDVEAARSNGQRALILNKVALGLGIGMHAIWIVTLIIVIATGLVFTSSASHYLPFTTASPFGWET